MVAQRVRQLRKELQLSMAEFGRRLGCSRDVIGNIEYGRVQPKEVFLHHVCEVFGASPQWLHSGEGPMFAESQPPEDEQTRQAAAIFRSLSPELREWAMSQLKSMQKLMAARAQPQKEALHRDAETIELLGALVQAGSMQEFAQAHPAAPPEDLPTHLASLLKAAGLPAAQAAQRAHLPQAEVAALLKGAALPRRDALLALALALGLDMDGAQRLLALAGLPALYVKNRRDSVFVFALMKKMAVPEVETLLAELDEAPLH